MKREDWTENEIKIADLIYSNKGELDVLVLEMVKKFDEFPKNLKPLLIYVMMFSEKREIRESYFRFLKRDFESLFVEKISEYIYGNYDNFQTKIVDLFFKNEVKSELYFTDFKRTKYFAPNIYIANISKNHPGRKEVFQHFIDTSKNESSYRILINGLSKEEAEIYLLKSEISFKETNFASIINFNLDDLPTPFYNWKIFNLNIENCIADNIFYNIFKFSSLHNLSISATSFSKIPSDWTSLTYLRRLSFLRLNYTFESLDFLNQLPGLERLNLYSGPKLLNPYLLITNKKLPITSALYFHDLTNFKNHSNQITKVNAKELLKIGYQLGSSILSQEEQIKNLPIIIQLVQSKQLPELPVYDLLALLNINYSKLKAACLNDLSKIAESNDGISKITSESKLVISGNISMKKGEVKRLFEKIGGKVIKTVSTEVTHVLVGKNPKNYKEFEDLNFDIITESQLNRLSDEAEPKYIQEALISGNNELVEKISDFLYSCIFHCN